jgi:hypothetical protein
VSAGPASQPHPAPNGFVLQKPQRRRGFFVSSAPWCAMPRSIVRCARGTAGKPARSNAHATDMYEYLSGDNARRKRRLRSSAGATRISSSGWASAANPPRPSARRGSQGGAARGDTFASANSARWRQPAAHAPSRAKLRGRGAGIRRARPRQEGLSRRRDHGAGHAEAKLVQICRVRQERLRRYGENRRPGELRRTVVLRRDLAGRAQYPQCRCTRERQRIR